MSVPDMGRPGIWTELFPAALKLMTHLERQTQNPRWTFCGGKVLILDEPSGSKLVRRSSPRRCGIAEMLAKRVTCTICVPSRILSHKPSSGQHLSCVSMARLSCKGFGVMLTWSGLISKLSTPSGYLETLIIAWPRHKSLLIGRQGRQISNRMLAEILS